MTPQESNNTNSPNKHTITSAPSTPLKMKSLPPTVTSSQNPSPSSYRRTHAPFNAGSGHTNPSFTKVPISPLKSVFSQPYFHPLPSQQTQQCNQRNRPVSPLPPHLRQTGISDHYTNIPPTFATIHDLFFKTPPLSAISNNSL
jgi:hypothetical protein